MIRHWLIALWLFLPGLAAAADIGALFDQSGKPQLAVQRLVARAGLPELVEGAPWVFPRHLLLVEQVGCVTIRFEVGPDGMTDNFQILDSKPKGAFDQVVLNSLAHWKFKATGRSYDAVLPTDFGIEPSTGTRLGRNSQACLIPTASVSKQDVRAKAVKNRRMPFYTADMITRRAQGCIRIGFVIRPDGLADDYELLTALPEDQALADAAVQALNLWTFESPDAGTARSSVTFDFRVAPLPPPSADCNQDAARTAAARENKP